MITLVGTISERITLQGVIDGFVPTYHLTFDGIDDDLVIPHAASIDNLPLGDFTVEWAGSFLDVSGYIVTKTDLGTVGWEIYFAAGNIVYFYVTYDGYAHYVDASMVTNLLPHHYEASFTAATHTVRFWVDGIEVVATTNSTGGYIVYDDDSANDLFVGAHVSDDYYLAVSLNWLRISNVARHTANFTPPSLTVAPADDADTVLLLALDAGTGTVAADTSGNSNNGMITGAAWVVD